MISEQNRLRLVRVLALVAVVAISILIFVYRDRARELAVYGYPGIFVLSILANATVFLPAPGVAIVFAFGAVLNPIGVALAAGAGAAIGELSGYLAGFSGQAVVARADLYARLTGWMEKNIYLAYMLILVLAFVPNPFFDLAGIAAGALKMPMGPFLLWAFIGKTLKMLLFAYAGASSLDWLLLDFK